jgi:hypothetical protein
MFAKCIGLGRETGTAATYILFHNIAGQGRRLKLAYNYLLCLAAEGIPEAMHHLRRIIGVLAQPLYVYSLDVTSYSSILHRLIPISVHLTRRDRKLFQRNFRRKLVAHVLDVQILRASRTESCECIAQGRLELLEISSCILKRWRNQFTE